jgi:hypothetical protein
MYVFGGHGGVSYQRKTFNDLYALNTETWEWEELKPEGEPPQERGGHSAALLPGEQLMFYGGFSTTSQLANMYIYDIPNHKWIDPENQYDIPRWNHTGILVKSIPKMKYFVFGGSIGNFGEGDERNFGNLTNDLFYLDIDEKNSNMTW